MQLKTVQHTAAALFSLGIIFVIVAIELERFQRFFVAAIVVIVVTDLVLVGIFWRCPRCKEFLGRFGDVTEYCPHCGEKLDLD